MALLEPVYWQSKELPLALKQVVLAPDLTTGYPTSPTPNPSVLSLLSPTSQDSGFNSRPLSPTSPNNSMVSYSEQPTPTHPIFPSQHFIAAVGTGFSLSVINCDKGSMHQLSVPFPQQLPESSSDDVTAFTLSDIDALAIVGEAQLWAGTRIGTLHCFDLTPEMRLKNHTCININEPILCIASRPVECVFPSISQPSCALPSTSLTTEILIGLPYGYIILLAGEADSRGHLKRSVNRLSSRRIIRFTNSPVDCAVNCIAHVPSEKEGECYWCGCGGTIFVLRSSDWKKLKQIQPVVPALPDDNKVEVSQLLPTEVGVWSYLTGFSSITLWDRTDFTVKLHLNYCNTKRSLNLRHQTSCLHYSHPFLFIGTRQGDVIVFKIRETIEEQAHSNTSYDYRFISSTHVGSDPILNVLTSIADCRSNNVLSSVPPTPTSSLINVLVLEAAGTSGKSKVHMFELSLSPPHSLCSSPLSDITIMSSSSLRNSLTPRRLSLVSSSADYVPLKN